jgi:hypothetical protein
MFGLFAAAVLTFASGVQTQRGLTEKTASSDSAAEGSAQFAIADTAVQGCGTVTSGTMKFASGDALSYAAGAGACSASSSTAPEQDCGLCVLNYENVTTPLSVQKGQWTVPGEVDVNGSISLKTITSGSRIGLFGAGAKCATTCTPTPVTALISKVLDPLAGALPVPTPAANPPSASGGTICPGTYKNLSVSGGDLYLAPHGQAGCSASTSPSVYIITGSMSMSGNASIVANGATLYFTASASLDTTGNGNFSINCGGGPAVPANCNSPTTPTSGPYAGVSLFFDPKDQSTINYGGNGNDQVAGTFEASHMTIDLQGNGGANSFQSGRLIVSQLTGMGNGGAGLGFGGAINSSGCNFWNDSLTGTLASGSSLAAHVRFETDCNSGSPTMIIGFAYGNGP